MGGDGYLTALLPKMVGSKAKQFCPEKPSALFFFLHSPFTVKTPFSYDKTANKAASVPISLAATTVYNSKIF